MTVPISNTNLNDSFNTWRLNTNYMATVISNNVVTVSRDGSANRNAVSVGNGHIKGTFTANELATTTLRSGNTSSQGGLLNVVSNTLFNATTLTVDANTTFNGNVTFNTAGTDRVNMGSVDRLIISGGTVGQFMRLSTQNDNPEFKSLTLRDITDLSSNASHIYLSGSNTTFSSNKDSTHLVFTGGLGDRIDLYLAADATLGDSDLFLKLVDATGDSRFVITDSANVVQFTVTSDGAVHAVGAVDFGSTLAVTGATSLSSTLDVVGKTTMAALHANGNIDTDGTLTVDSNATVGGTLGVTGAATFANSITVGNNSTFSKKLTVSGNTAVTGTMTVTGATALNGGLTMDTNKFTVADTTGNVSTAGTLTVTGATALNGGLTMDTNKFTVADTTGNVSTAGTLNVAGKSTIAALHANGNVDTDGNLNVDGTSYLNAVNTKSITANTTLTVKGSSALNAVTATTLTANGAATFNGSVTLGDASTDTITVKGNFANQSTTGTSVFNGAATFNSTATFNGTMNINGNVVVGDNASDTLNVTSTASLNGNTTIGDSAADKLTVNSRITSDLIANTVSSNYNLGSKDLRWSRAYANTVVYGNTVIHRTETTETVLFGKNARLHVNNAVTDSTIRNQKLLNTGVKVAGNTGTTSNMPLGSTFSVVSGTAKGITTAVSANTLTISGVDASATVKGVAKYDSGDFSVTSGTVALKDSADGAVLSISGTTNEVEVSRTNGTVTVGLPDSVSLTSNLTVGGKIISTLTANGSTINIGDNRAALNEATRSAMYLNGGLTTFNVYANTVFHDNVTLTGGTVTTGNGIFTFATVNNLTNLKGTVLLGDATDDIIAFKGRANTNIVPNANATYDIGTSTLNWRDVYVKGKIAAGTTTIIGTNQKLHANNTITSGTIRNTHLENSSLTFAANSGTSAATSLGGTLNIKSGTATGIATSISGSNITISGVNATSAIKGVAKFDSGDFSVSSGNVTLANSVNGAVLSIAGTANEVNVSRTNGTVTVGLPDDVTITSDLMVGGGVFISGNLTVTGTTTTVNTETINLADNIIKLNSNLGAATAPSESAGLSVNRGNAANTELVWNEVTDRWTFTNNGTTFYNIPISTEYDNYGSWTASANSTTYTLGSGQTLTYTQGNDLDVMFTAARNMRIGHKNISRTNTTSTAAPTYGGTFTVIDSITTNARGHITDVNTKTVTVPASDNTDTKQNITADTTNAWRYISFVNSATGAQEGKSSTTLKFNPSTGATIFNSIIPQNGFYVQTANQATTNWDGYLQSYTAGRANGTGSGGYINIAGGAGSRLQSSVGNGGAVRIIGGQGSRNSNVADVYQGFGGNGGTAQLIGGGTDNGGSGAGVYAYGGIGTGDGGLLETIAGNASGTNKTGGGVNIYAGKGTGTGTSGNITMYISKAGYSSGSYLNAWTKALEIAASSGKITTGEWGATTIATTVGGTGLTSYATGDILYASGTNTLAKLAKGTSGQVLKMGASNVPIWSTDNNDNTTYSQSVSTATGGVNLNLVAGGSGSGISAVDIKGSGATTVTRTDANTITISSTDTVYSLPLAANGTRGGVQTGYTTSGKNYAVQLSSEKMYVNVPWTDTTYTASNGVALSGTNFSMANTYTGTNFTMYHATNAVDAHQTLNFKSAFIGTNGLGDTHDTGEVKFFAHAPNGSEFVASKIIGTSLTFNSGSLSDDVIGRLSLEAYNTDSTSGVKSTAKLYLNSNPTGYSYISSASEIRMMCGNSGDFVVYNEITGGSSYELIRVDGATGTLFANYGLTVAGDTAITGSLSATGEVTAYASDARLKTNVEVIADPLAKLQSIRGISYEWNEEGQKLGLGSDKHIGVIAQEVEEVLPELVVDSALEGYKTVKYDKLTALLIESVKAQQEQIELLKKEIEDLKANK